MKKQQTGFNLIELIITLTIIIILSMFSFPIYSHHVVKERRLEAATTLGKLAGAMEQFYISNNSYEGATLNQLGFSEKILGNYYQLIIETATPTSYIVSAQPLNEQADKDILCGSLRLTSTGEKTISGTGKLNECW